MKCLIFPHKASVACKKTIVDSASGIELGMAQRYHAFVVVELHFLSTVRARHGSARNYEYRLPLVYRQTVLVWRRHLLSAVDALLKENIGSHLHPMVTGSGTMANMRGKM